MPTQTLFKRLFARRDNLFSLVIIVVSTTIALLSLFTSYIALGVLLSAILFVLSLLAITNIIERESRFEIADAKLESLIRMGRVRGSVFESVRDIPLMENYITGADELFFTGGHLNALVLSNTNLFAAWLRAGKSLKFILQNPENKGLQYLVMPCVNYQCDEYVKQIKLSLERLRILQRIPNGNIEVRLTDITPTQSVTILDGHKGGTEMRLLIHMPSGDGSTAPFVRLTRTHEEMWFNLFYNRYYKHMWEEARPFP